MLSADFYQEHLDRVSRSFAFCIQQLPSPLRDWVGLSYLLCRVVDTIEDAPWNDGNLQRSAFQCFDESLERASQVEGLLALNSSLSGISDGERDLLKVAPALMRDYHQLPASVHEVLHDAIQSMSLGMQHFSDHRPLRLKNLSEVNQYCFFVAGVVGELLANLLAQFQPDFQITQDRLLSAHHFGLFLQKVNLLKDQVEDEQVGRYLVPDRQKVEDSAGLNAAKALEFLKSIPTDQLEFRRFCAWSLFLGLESLLVSRDSVKFGRALKVERTRTQELLAEVEAKLLDNLEMGLLFSDFARQLGWGSFERPLAQSEIPIWILENYRGSLSSTNLQFLGIASA